MPDWGFDDGAMYHTRSSDSNANKPPSWYDDAEGGNDDDPTAVHGYTSGSPGTTPTFTPTYGAFCKGLQGGAFREYTTGHRSNLFGLANGKRADEHGECRKWCTADPKCTGYDEARVNRRDHTTHEGDDRWMCLLQQGKNSGQCTLTKTKRRHWQESPEGVVHRQRGREFTCRTDVAIGQPMHSDGRVMVITGLQLNKNFFYGDGDGGGDSTLDDDTIGDAEQTCREECSKNKHGICKSYSFRHPVCTALGPGCEKYTPCLMWSLAARTDPNPDKGFPTALESGLASQPGWKHCVKDALIENKGAEACTREEPCDVCQGDCDVDEDCEGDLKCFQRTKASATVPGCLAEKNWQNRYMATNVHWDYCYSGAGNSGKDVCNTLSCPYGCAPFIGCLNTDADTWNWVHYDRHKQNVTGSRNRRAVRALLPGSNETCADAGGRVPNTKAECEALAPALGMSALVAPPGGSGDMRRAAVGARPSFQSSSNRPLGKRGPRATTVCRAKTKKERKVRDAEIMLKIAAINARCGARTVWTTGKTTTNTTMAAQTTTSVATLIPARTSVASSESFRSCGGQFNHSWLGHDFEEDSWVALNCEFRYADWGPAPEPTGQRLGEPGICTGSASATAKIWKSYPAMRDAAAPRCYFHKQHTLADGSGAVYDQNQQIKERRELGGKPLADGQLVWQPYCGDYSADEWGQHEQRLSSDIQTLCLQSPSSPLVQWVHPDTSPHLPAKFDEQHTPEALAKRTAQEQAEAREEEVPYFHRVTEGTCASHGYDVVPHDLCATAATMTDPTGTERPTILSQTDNAGATDMGRPAGCLSAYYLPVEHAGSKTEGTWAPVMRMGHPVAYWGSIYSTAECGSKSCVRSVPGFATAANAQLASFHTCSSCVWVCVRARTRACVQCAPIVGGLPRRGFHHVGRWHADRLASDVVAAVASLPT